MPAQLPKRSGPTCASNTKSALDPQPWNERMKIVLNYNSAIEREEIPHATNSNPNNTLKVNRDASLLLTDDVRSL